MSNMNEQLISFETAKLAKEKGFDATLNHCYNLDGELLNDGKLKAIAYLSHLGSPYGQYTNDDLNVSIFDMDNSLDEYVLAPTQSLLQKWLRDTYNINTYVDAYGGTVVPKWQCFYNIAGHDEHMWLGKGPFLSYEDALEAGLYEALQLV